MRRIEIRYGAAVICAIVLALGGVGCPVDVGEPANPLREVASFASIAEESARSKALFVEAGRVIQHPRCLNCHPLDAHPRQGETLAMHQPPVVRGEDLRGFPAARCGACHQSENVDHARMPGHPDWHLAPEEMGWIGLSLGEICERLKGQESDGGMSLEEIHEHMARDPLVGWAWSPGEGREPAPGDQESFGRLVRTWIDTGAHCPDGTAGEAAGPVPASDVGCEGCHGG